MTPKDPPTPDVVFREVVDRPESSDSGAQTPRSPVVHVERVEPAFGERESLIPVLSGSIIPVLGSLIPGEDSRPNRLFHRFPTAGEPDGPAAQASSAETSSAETSSAETSSTEASSTEASSTQVPTGAVAKPKSTPSRKERARVASLPWEAMPQESTSIFASSLQAVARSVGPFGDGKAGKRRQPRFPVVVKAEVGTSTGLNTALRTRDLSMRGLFVDASSVEILFFQQGMRCTVRLGEGPRIVSCEAEVVRIVRRGPRCGVGLKIVTLLPEQEPQLAHLIASGVRKRRRPVGWRLSPRAAAIAASLCALVFGAIYVATPRLGVPTGVTAVARGDITRSVRSSSPGEALPAQRTTVRWMGQAPAVIRVEVKRDERVKTGAVVARAITAGEGARGNVTSPAADADRGRVLAPFDGFVADLRVNTGDLVAPTAAICDLVDDGKMRVRLPFAESDAPAIAVGAPAQVTVTGAADVIFGTVQAIDPVVRADARGREVFVEIELPAFSRVKAGASASAEIVLEHRQNALLVPRSALLGEEGRRSVFVVDSKSQLQAVPATVGIANATEVEVTDGLAEGSLVVTDAGARGLTAGLRVAPVR